MADARENVIAECIFVLVGTKSDLPREIDYEEGITFLKAQKLDIFFETSAKTGENIVSLFESAAKELIEKSVVIKAVREREQTNIQLRLDQEKAQQNKSCC